MTHSFSSTATQRTRSAVKTVLWAGLVAGTLDISAAMLLTFIRTGKNPLAVLNFVASGVFGKEAFSGSVWMQWWGLLFHFIIAYSFALFFFLIYPKIGFLSKNKFITGVSYGLFAWIVMNLIVLPMSNIARAPFDISRAVIGIAVLMVMIGLPISIIVHKFYSSAK